jgi:two-component system OmpR family response regulator
MKVLVVDDDAPLRDIVRFAIEREGFDVREAGDGVEALALLAREPCDLMILDVAMPRMDGMTLCRHLRSGEEPGLPIIFLTARDDEVDRVLGLELGGDDYVTKPFSPRELASRAKAVLRRTGPRKPEAPPEPEAHRHGPIRLDPVRRQVFVATRQVALTATEHDILATLLRYPGKVYTRSEIVDSAYGPGHHVSDRTVDSHVRNLRLKLEGAGCHLLQTVHGVGFRLIEA